MINENCKNCVKCNKDKIIVNVLEGAIEDKNNLHKSMIKLMENIHKRNVNKNKTYIMKYKGKNN